jgi:hypothetical protein
MPSIIADTQWSVGASGKFFCFYRLHDPFEEALPFGQDGSLSNNLILVILSRHGTAGNPP